MGISYQGVLCVGYTYKEIEELYEKCLEDNGDYTYDDTQALVEDLELDIYSPYYDADWEDCIYGEAVVRSNDYSCAEVSKESLSHIEQISERLEKVTHLKPKIYIMAYGR